MKTIQKRWLPLFLLAAVIFLFPACEGNNTSVDDDDSYNIVQECSDGIYLGGYNWQQRTGYYYIKLCGNMFGNFVDTHNGYAAKNTMKSVKFVNIGKVNNLNEIKEIPNTGFSEKADITVGNGYVIEVTYEYKYNGVYTSDIYYCRLFVKEYLNYGAVSGYKYAFQRDWNTLYN